MIRSELTSSWTDDPSGGRIGSSSHVCFNAATTTGGFVAETSTWTWWRLSADTWRTLVDRWGPSCNLQSHSEGFRKFSDMVVKNVCVTFSQSPEISCLHILECHSCAIDCNSVWQAERLDGSSQLQHIFPNANCCAASVFATESLQLIMTLFCLKYFVLNPFQCQKRSFSPTARIDNMWFKELWLSRRLATALIKFPCPGLSLHHIMIRLGRKLRERINKLPGFIWSHAELDSLGAHFTKAATVMCTVAAQRSIVSFWLVQIMAVISVHHYPSQKPLFFKDQLLAFHVRPKTLISSHLRLITTSVLYSLTSAPVTTRRSDERADGNEPRAVLTQGRWLTNAFVPLRLYVCVLNGLAQLLLQVLAQLTGFACCVWCYRQLCWRC